MSEKPRSKAAERQQRYRDRKKARNAQSVTESVTADERDVTPDKHNERNEYDEMVDDPGFVPPPMTSEEKERSDAVPAELRFEA